MVSQYTIVFYKSDFEISDRNITRCINVKTGHVVFILASQSHQKHTDYVTKDTNVPVLANRKKTFYEPEKGRQDKFHPDNASDQLSLNPTNKSPEIFDKN